MDSTQAKEILGVDKNASFEEIRLTFRTLVKKYHPDIPITGDEKKFIMISSAYLLLQGNEVGVNKSSLANNDIGEALSLKKEIDDKLNIILEEYKQFRQELEKSTNDYVKDSIFRTNSTEELKSAIENKVAKHLVDVKATLGFYLKRLDKQVKASSDNRLFQEFQDLYRERRRYWLYTLYKNPVTIGTTASSIILELAKNAPDVLEAYPTIMKVTSVWWLPLSIVAAGTIVLLFQYILLNPKQQFVPPKLSIVEITKLVETEAAKIKEDKSEKAVQHGLIWGIVGTIILPGIGTAIGAAIGALGGNLFGKSITKMKEEANDGIRSELSYSFKQVDNCIERWIKQAKEDLLNASIDSFKKNCQNISGYLNSGS